MITSHDIIVHMFILLSFFLLLYATVFGEIKMNIIKKKIKYDTIRYIYIRSKADKRPA